MLGSSFCTDSPLFPPKDKVALPPSSPLRHLPVRRRLEAPVAEQVPGILASLKPAISEPPPPAGAGCQRRELIRRILSDILNAPVGFALSSVPGSSLSFHGGCLRAVLRAAGGTPCPRLARIRGRSCLPGAVFHPCADSRALAPLRNDIFCDFRQSSQDVAGAFDLATDLSPSLFIFLIGSAVARHAAQALK